MNSTLKFEGENAFLEIIPVDKEVLGEDRYLSIVVSSNGFGGHNDLWVTAQDLGAFASELKKLEQTRRGKATLNGIVEDELLIIVEAIDLSGHMAVHGKTGYRVQGSWNASFFHSVEFGFEFDPSQLVNAIKKPWLQGH